MLAAEIASVTAKPSMILARNRRVGNLIDRDPLRPKTPTSAPVFILKTQRIPEALPPEAVGKSRTEWIKTSKFGRLSASVADASAGFYPPRRGRDERSPRWGRRECIERRGG